MSVNAVTPTSDVVDEKLSFFREVWENSCEHSHLIESPDALVSPHTLLHLLADEAANHSLKNEAVRRYLLKMLGTSVRGPLRLPPRITSDLKLILAEMNSGKAEYLRQLALGVLAHFASGGYFRVLHDALVTILLEPAWNAGDEARIERLVSELIVEFLMASHSLDSVSRVARSILSDLRQHNEGFYTNYPVGIDTAQFKRDGKFDKHSFNAALKSAMDGLTRKDRVNAIRTVYEAPAKSHTFIFEIQGLTGEEFDLELGPVNVYSPRRKRYLIEAELAKLEERDAKPDNTADEKRAFARAACRVMSVDTQSGKAKAIEQIEAALDLVRCFYRPKARFHIVAGNYVVGDDEGWSGWGSSIERDEVAYRRLEGLDLDRYRLDEALQRVLPAFPAFLFADAKAQSSAQRKVNYSLHWFRKGAESARAEDRILCFWIAIEHLFENDEQIRALVDKKVLDDGKSGIISEVLSAMLIRFTVRRIGWDLRDEFDQDSRLFAIKLPDELAVRAQARVAVGQVMELKKFVSCLGEILPHVPRRSMASRVRYCMQLFGPADQARSLVRRLLDQASDELMLVYRYRNKIVHNAQFTDPLLLYYSQKAEHYARWLISQALKAMIEDPHSGVTGLIGRLYTQGRSLVFGT